MKKFDIHEWQAKYLFEQSTNLYGPNKDLYHKRDKLKREIEVTGMEPDSSNMESEYKIIGPENKNEPLDNVSIEYKGEVFVLNFEEGDVIDDHGNEGKDMTFVAYSDDDLYRFIVDVSVDANYDESDVIHDIFWDTLEIDIDDAKKDPRMDPAIRSDFDDPVMDEMNTTGTGASFNAGSGEGYMTPNAFKKKNK